jgi:hypothetical protein
VLLGTAVVVALTVLRNPAPKVAPPVASEAPSGGPAAPSSSSPGPKYNDPPMSDLEARDSHLHIAHEMCEEGAKRINELEGLAPTDPKGIRIIGACLRHGNVAWYKCIVNAATRLDAGTCNRRFLTGDTPR